MPYLKIKVANDGKDSDWAVINNLNLDTLSVSGNTAIDGNATIKGNTTIGDAASDTLTVNANVTTFKSAGIKDGKNQSIEISNGELKIQSSGNTPQSLSEYLNLNTSGCTVGDSSEPGSYTKWGNKTPKKGDLYIQLKTEDNDITYSLLWYRDNSEWKRVYAIWG